MISPVLSHRFSNEDSIIAKSRNIQFPPPELFGKVSYFTINNICSLVGNQVCPVLAVSQFLSFLGSGC